VDWVELRSSQEQASGLWAQSFLFSSPLGW
jgi:hypothetical protein